MFIIFLNGFSRTCVEVIIIIKISVEAVALASLEACSDASVDAVVQASGDVCVDPAVKDSVLASQIDPPKFKGRLQTPCPFRPRYLSAYEFKCLF